MEIDNKCKCNCDCNIIEKEKVETISKKVFDDELIMNMADFFKIFGDPTRLKIINVLLHDSLCVADIANILNMTHSAISHQLKYLKNFKIVKDTKSGKVVYYELDDNHIVEIFDKGCEHINE